MAYRKEERDAVVDLYFETGKSCKTIINELDLSFKVTIFQEWIKKDIRYKPQIHKIYSPQVKLRAMQMLRNGKREYEICDILHINSKGLVKSWKKLYDLKGADAFMKKKIASEVIPTELPLYPPRPKIGNKENIDISVLRELEEANEQLIFENRCLQAENKLLKKSKGSVRKSNGSISNSGKTLLITSLSPEYKIRRLCKQFKIERSSYYYCVKHPIVDKWLLVDDEIAEFMNKNEEHKTKSGYRKVLLAMKNEKKIVPERRVRIVMKKNSWGLKQYKSMKRYHSYVDDGNQPAPNWLYDSETKEHFFKPEFIWEVLATDVSEIHINGFKIFISVIMDLHDSAIISYRIGRHPDMDLILGTLTDALKKAQENARFLVHSDQGSVYRTVKWKEICSSNHILQSMSRKGMSGDNAAMEGFFGRLKQEWFNHGDFCNMDYDAIVSSLEKYFAWYNERRIQSNLKTSPKIYREKLALLVQA